MRRSLGWLCLGILAASGAAQPQTANTPVSAELVQTLLNRIEMLPWDVWGLMTMDDAGLTDQDKALLDRIAALSLAGDEALSDIRAVYESDDRIRVPPGVFNALRNTSEPITV